MNYAMRKSAAVNSEATLRQFSANNGTTFSPSVNEIRINVAADGFLDGSKSYLYFTINNGNANAGENLALDSDALCWVDQLRIESNGQVLERLDRAAVWNNLQARWKGAVGQAYARNAKCGGPPGGAADLSNAGQVIDEATSATFACPLPLGFLNAHHGKAIPQGASFDIVVRCNSTAGQCFTWENAGATTFTITNPRFYAPVYRVNDGDVMAEYSQAVMESGITWSGDIVKTYINSIPAGAGTRNLQINDRSMSLKALVSVLRTDTLIALATSSSVGASTLLGLSQMRYVIAGKNYPQDQIQYSATDCGRLYEECQKALAKDGHSHSEPLVSKATFTATDATAQGTIAVDLKKFDDDKLMMVGLNTASSSAPNTLELITDANAVASEVATFGVAEGVFLMDGRGQMSVSA
jgi:hypothetical protein